MQRFLTTLILLASLCLPAAGQMLLKQSTSVVLSFGPFTDETDGVGLVITLESALDHATTGIRLAKNGGTLTVRAAAVTASTYDSYGNYKVTLSATDTNTLGILRVQFNDHTTNVPVWQDFMVVGSEYHDLVVGGNVASVADIYAEPVPGTYTAGQAGYVIGNNLRYTVAGTADSGTTTTIVDAARTEADTNYWTGSLIVFTSGTISGQSRYIDSFTPATDTITFTPATTVAAGTNTYEIWPMADFLRATTSGRKLDVSATGEAGLDWANVGSPTTTVGLSGTTVGTVTTTGTATNVTTVNGLAANVLTAASAAPDLTTELQTGLATAAALTVVDDFLDTEVAAIKTKTDFLPSATAGTAGGLFIAGSNVATTVNFTGNLSGSVGSVSALGSGAISESTFATTAGSFEPLGIIDQGTAQSATATSLQLRAAASFATSELIGADILITGGTTGVGQIRKITAYTGSTDTATVATWTTTPTGTITYQLFASTPATGGGGTAPTAVEIADQVWDEVLASHLTAGTTGAALNTATSLGDPLALTVPGAYSAGTAGFVLGTYLTTPVTNASSVTRTATAQAGGSTSITLDASASAVDDFYNQKRIAVLSGTGVGQTAIITDYVGSTKVATISCEGTTAGAWRTNPSSDSVFVISPRNR